MDNTIIYATCDNDADTACFPKYITLPLKWLTKGSKRIAKLQTSYFDVLPCILCSLLSRPTNAQHLSI
jgi:hypothetical protein